VEKKKTTNL